MKIIRTLALLIIVAFLLPSPPESQSLTASTPAMVSAAVTAAGDVGSFCQRQPTVCGVASEIGNTLEAKVRYSIRLAYEWANTPEANQPAAGAKPAPAPQGNVLVVPAPFQLAEAVIPSQSTLKLEDLLPEWRDPHDIRRG